MSRNQCKQAAVVISQLILITTLLIASGLGCGRVATEDADAAQAKLAVDGALSGASEHPPDGTPNTTNVPDAMPAATPDAMPAATPDAAPTCPSDTHECLPAAPPGWQAPLL